ncbi:hypothetical protein JHK85_007144 [Glycine max]|nr:hypothetical protein JHK85_007144 [Glycine max]KAG5071740.1 hypothetical protein JHK86_006951 [Glycine max]
MHGSDILWRVRQIPLCLPQWNLISEIPGNCLHNLLLSEEIIHRNNELLLISTHLRSLNVQEFFYSILFLLLVAGYLARTHLLFVSRVYSELQTEFKKVKYLMIPSYMIELRKLLDRYPTSELNSFWLKNLFLVAMEQLITKNVVYIWRKTLTKVHIILHPPLYSNSHYITSRRMNYSSLFARNLLIKNQNERSQQLKAEHREVTVRI